jgi:hypothetical protein
VDGRGLQRFVVPFQIELPTRKVETGHVWNVIISV